MTTKTRALLLTSTLAACGGASLDVEVSESAVVPLGSLRVFYDVPAVYTGYTGLVPVTFGIPFEAGKMLPAHKRRLLASGTTALESQFEVTGSWSNGSVKWLLVDALIPITNGVAPPTVLEWGPSVVENIPTQPISVVQGPSGIDVRTNNTVYHFGPGDHAIGRFELSTDNFASTTKVFSTEATLTNVTIEKAGKIRTTLKLEGLYRHPDGSTYGQFKTRIRFYARTPYTRIFHTMVWDQNDGQGIGSLAFVPKGPIPGGTSLQYGLDGVLTTGNLAELFQTGPNTVVDLLGHPVANRLDGYLQSSWGSQSLFMGLRWAWQQFPVRLEGGHGTTKLHLIGPEVGTPMSLAPSDVASPKGPPLNLEAYHDDYLDVRPGGHGPYGEPLSPRGVGKTFELLIWASSATAPSSGHAVPATIRNALLQQPIFAYAAPSHSVKAGLPNPLSARDPVNFPTIEGAIDRAFDWMFRENAVEGDYGTWNFGDLQYSWTDAYGDPSAPSSHYLAYRYWMNQGKGSASVPWILFLRSGARKYLDRGESYARHLMDVDTCHLTHQGELKFTGGVSAYQPIHFGIVTWPASFLADSEYLGLYYHLTGYERAKDIIEERRVALTTPTGSPTIVGTDGLLAFLNNDYVGTSGLAKKETLFNREHYRTIGELATIYEETNDPLLLSLLQQLITNLAASQAINGYLPGLKSNHWMSHPLNIARRVMTGSYPTTIFNILRRWEEHLGNFRMPAVGPGLPGIVEGPSSLWTTITLEQGLGEPRYLEVAAKTALSQALSVHDDSGAFIGLTAIPVEYLGPQIRDWTVVLARLSQLTPSQRPAGPAPALHYNSGLLISDTNAWDGRHLLYVGEEVDGPISLDFDFAAGNQGSQQDLKFRVYAPDGVTSEWTHHFQTMPTEYDTFAAAGFTPPFELEVLSHYTRSKSITIPADGKVGAYAIEVFNKTPSPSGLEMPIWARSSTGKLVHYLPSFVERSIGGAPAGVTPFQLYYSPPLGYAKDGGSIVSGGGSPSFAYAGSFWYRPKASLGPVTFGMFTGGTPTPTTPQTTPFVFDPTYYRDWPKLTALAANGTTTLCSTHVVGVDALLNPIGTPCSYQPTSTRLAQANVPNTNWHYSAELTGIEPFISATEGEWFDPRAVGVQHPDEQSFLVPGQ